MLYQKNNIMYNKADECTKRSQDDKINGIPGIPPSFLSKNDAVMFHNKNIHQFHMPSQAMPRVPFREENRFYVQPSVSFSNGSSYNQPMQKAHADSRSGSLETNRVSLAKLLIKERQKFFQKYELLMHVDYCLCNDKIKQIKFNKNGFETTFSNPDRCICGKRKNMIREDK
ncbi:hypothetical protein NUSPORA_02449 [Nucleospora cyclopteri]